MGTGSGIQLINCLKAGILKNNILAIDINKEAIKNFKIKTIKSNLFSKIPKNKKLKFDLIIFNPPYLPENKYDKLPDTTGGKKGDETFIRFIKQLNGYLTKNGVCFLLISSLTPDSDWLAEAKKQKLNVNKIKTKSLFQEKLYIWEIKNKI